MRTITFILSILLLGSTVAGQNFHRRIPDLQYARTELNRIQFAPGGSPAFERFYRKLDTVILSGKGNLRILQIGGSHVQGGSWSQQLRRDLLLVRYGLDGGRGLVFPYSAAGTNTPMGYTSSYTGTWNPDRCLKTPHTDLGVTGISITTDDPSSTFTISMSERGPREWSPSFTFNKVDLLGYGNLEPIIIMGRDTVRSINATPVKGRWHFDLPRFTEEITVGFHPASQGEFTVNGVYLDNPFSGITYSEVGINGASTSSYLRCDNFQRDLEFLSPDLVIFCISINDIQGDFDPSHFISNYNKLVKMVNNANPDCAILFTTCNDSYRHRAPNRNTVPAVNAFKTLTLKHDAGLWDLYEIMGGYGSMQSWEYSGYAQGDKIHFTPAGYDILGNLLFNALMDGYWQHKTTTAR